METKLTEGTKAVGTAGNLEAERFVGGAEGEGGPTAARIKGLSAQHPTLPPQRQARRSGVTLGAVLSPPPFHLPVVLLFLLFLLLA